jgi:hypothetical protein
MDARVYERSLSDDLSSESRPSGSRRGLTMTDLKDQVRTDIERYRARGRCTSLLCFIYDPDGRIGNPRGIENELTSTSEQFTVDIVVAPK